MEVIKMENDVYFLIPRMNLTVYFINKQNILNTNGLIRMLDL